MNENISHNYNKPNKVSKMSEERRMFVGKDNLTKYCSHNVYSHCLISFERKNECNRGFWIIYSFSKNVTLMILVHQINKFVHNKKLGILKVHENVTAFLIPYATWQDI